MKYVQKPKFLIPVLLLLILLVVGSIAGYAMGRYRTDVVLTDSVTVRTRLADSFRLETTRSGGARSEDDTAYLLPGAELALRLSLEGKTAIRSYLYVEITGDLEPSMVAEGWKLLEGVTGKHGGAVYAWQTVLDGTEEDLTVGILRKGLTMDADAGTSAPPLSFCGYLLQITAEAQRGEDAAKTTFTDRFPQG